MPSNILVDINSTSSGSSPGTWGTVPSLSATSITVQATNSVLLLIAHVSLKGLSSDNTAEFRFKVNGSSTGSPIITSFSDQVDEVHGSATLVWAIDNLSGSSNSFSVEWQTVVGSPEIDTGKPHTFQIIEITDGDASILVDQSSTSSESAPGSWGNLFSASSIPVSGTDSILLMLSNVGCIQSGNDGADFQFSVDSTKEGAITSNFSDSTNQASGFSGTHVRDGLSAGNHSFELQWQIRIGNPQTDTSRLRTFQVVEVSANAVLQVDVTTSSSQSAPASWANMTGMSGSYTPSASNSINLMIGNMNVDGSGSTDSSSMHSLAVGGTRYGSIIWGFYDDADYVVRTHQLWAISGLTGSKTFSWQWEDIKSTPTTDTSRPRTFFVIEFIQDTEVFKDVPLKISLESEDIFKDLSLKLSISDEEFKDISLKISLTDETTVFKDVSLKISLKSVNASDWFDNDWTCRKKIAIRPGKVAGNETDFPVLINFASDADLSASAQADGDDILFTSSDGTTKFNHEIEKYVTGTGELVAWVKVTSLSSTTPTEIYMYYGNSGASNQENITGTWDTNFKGVWHLAETGTGTRFDSTSNNNDATPTDYDGDEAITGQIDGADELDGIGEFLSTSLSLNSIEGTFTISAWARFDGAAGDTWAWIVGESAGAGAHFFIIGKTELVNNVHYRFKGLNGDTGVDVNKSIADGNWHYVTFTYNGTTGKLYFDGVDTGSSVTGTANFASSGNLELGRRIAFSAQKWDGAIDEIRMSNSARSANWISTTFNNQDDPSGFYGLSPEECIAFKDVPLKISLFAEEFKDVPLKISLDLDRFKDIPLKISLDIEQYKDSPLKISLFAEEFRDIPFKISLDIENFKDVPLKISLFAEEFKDIPLKISVFAEEFKDTPLKISLDIEQFKDLPLKISLFSEEFKDIPFKISLDIEQHKDIPLKLSLFAEEFKDIPLKISLDIEQYKDIPFKISLFAEEFKDVSLKISLRDGIEVFKDIPLKISISSEEFKDIFLKISLDIESFKDIPLKLSISDEQFNDIPLKITISEEQFKDISLKISVSDEQFNDIPLKISISDEQFKDILLKISLDVENFKDIPLAISISDEQFKDVALKISLAGEVFKDLPIQISISDEIFKDIPLKITISDEQFNDIPLKITISDENFKDISLKISISDAQFKDIPLKISLDIEQLKDISLKTSISDEQFKDLPLKISIKIFTPPIICEFDLTIPINGTKDLTVPINEAKDLTIPINEVKNLIIPINETKDLIIPINETKDLEIKC